MHNTIRKGAGVMSHCPPYEGVYPPGMGKSPPHPHSNSPLLHHWSYHIVISNVKQCQVISKYLSNTSTHKLLNQTQLRTFMIIFFLNYHFDTRDPPADYVRVESDFQFLITFSHLSSEWESETAVCNVHIELVFNTNIGHSPSDIPWVIDFIWCNFCIWLSMFII